MFPNLLKGNSWSDEHEARWSFLESTSTPAFLIAATGGGTLAFATRAWRRPLTADERAAILASCRADRADGVQHDPAFRGSNRCRSLRLP